MDFKTSWPKRGFRRENRRRGGAILTPNELVLTFGGSYVCANFGENRSRNATARVPTDGHTDTLIHWQKQTDFIICPMLYAIAVGQIKSQPLSSQKGFSYMKMFSCLSKVRLV